MAQPGLPLRGHLRVESGPDVSPDDVLLVGVRGEVVAGRDPFPDSR